MAYLCFMNNNFKDFELHRIASKNVVKTLYPSIDQNGDFKLLKGKDAIIQQIRNLLMTPLGFYPFDPNYGSLLYQKLFEFNDDVTKEELEYEVKDRVEQYVPSVTISKVNIEMSKKEAVVIVELKIKGEENNTELSVFMSNLDNTMISGDDSQSVGIWEDL